MSFPFFPYILGITYYHETLSLSIILFLLVRLNIYVHQPLGFFFCEQDCLHVLSIFLLCWLCFFMIG